MQLVNIGFGNLVSVGRLIAVVSPDSAPIKRLIQESRDRGMLIDATYGRKTAAVLVMDSDHVVLSALPAEKLGPRLGLSAEDFMQVRSDFGKARQNFYSFRPVRVRKGHGAQKRHEGASGHVSVRVRHHPRTPPG